MITAAASKWNVPRAQCLARKGAVLHEHSSRRATYGELVEAAEKLPRPDPEKVKLKDEKDFQLIGHATPRVDIPAKVNGSAVASTARLSRFDMVVIPLVVFLGT